MAGPDYLTLVKTRADLLFSRGHTESGWRAIAGLWDISIDRVGAENPASSQLLDICATGTEPIPLDLSAATLTNFRTRSVQPSQIR